MSMYMFENVYIEYKCVVILKYVENMLNKGLSLKSEARVCR